MTKGKLKIHTENILPIIKKWLYSNKDIFIRELVSNASDALGKLRILRDNGETEVIDEDLTISVTIDKQASTITITDTGIGMSSEEVEKYITQVAFSGAEEFLGKYKNQNEKESIIGHFGLGFYSAYMVAEKVTINTLSYQPNATAAFWECDGSPDYTLETSSKPSRGTEITLYVDKESDEFLEESRLEELLLKYCAFFPFPITLNGTLINPRAPLWMKPANECTEKEYIDFFHQLYPAEPDPLFWIHLNVDYPFNLKGILYFPKMGRRFDWSQNSIKLFCNRVFVSDNCKDLIPEYLMILKGAIDSPDIPLNVSRSTLQMDRTVKQLATHISKKIVDRLLSLYETDRSHFIATWPDIEVIVKLGLLQDDKFYTRAKEFLIWKNTQDNSWMTLDEYITRNDKQKIFYTTDEKNPLLSLYKEQKIEVLLANGHIDSALMNFLESKLSPVKFQRIDGAIDQAITDSSREKTLLDAQGKTEASRIADFIRSALSETEVEAKSLHHNSLPAFIVVDENMRRMREAMALSGQALPTHFGNKGKLVVNTNSPLIHAIFGLKDKKPSLAKELAAQVYDLSLLSQKELGPDQLTQFIDRSNRIYEELLS